MPGYLSGKVRSKDTRSRIESHRIERPPYQERWTQDDFDLIWRYGRAGQEVAAHLEDCASEGMSVNEAMDSLTVLIAVMTEGAFNSGQWSDLRRSVTRREHFDYRHAAMQFADEYARMIPYDVCGLARRR